MKLLVIGAGVSGLVAAKQATDRCFDVRVIESTHRIGGLMRSETIENRTYDIGAFVFYPWNPLFAVFPEINEVMFRQNRAVILKNIVDVDYIDTYPFSISGIVHQSSLTDMAKIAASYVRTLSSRKTDDFRSWVESQTGSSFYVRSGLKRYVERFFGLPDHEISMKFAKECMGFIRNFRAGRILRHGLRKCLRRVGFPDRTPEVQHALLRPESGFGEMFGVIEDSLRERGCEISTEEVPVNIERHNDSFSVTTNKRSNEVFDSIVLAAPPRSILDSFGENVPCSNVECFNLLSLYLTGSIQVEGDVLFNSSPYGRWKRMTVFNRLYNEPDEDDRFTVEVVVDQGNSDTDPEDAFEDFIASADRLNISTPGIRLCGSSLTDDAYPKLTIAQEHDVESQQELLADRGIVRVGRQGEYRYYSSTDCVDSTLSAIRQLADESG